MKSQISFPDTSVGKEFTCNAGDPGSIPGWGRSAGEGKGYPLQYSWTCLVAQLVKNPLPCGRPGFYSGLESSMDCIVHGVTKSWTRLGNFYFHAVNGASQVALVVKNPPGNAGDMRLGIDP